MFNAPSISEFYENTKRGLRIGDSARLPSSLEQFDFEKERARLYQKHALSPIEIIEDEIFRLPLENAHQDIPDGFGDGDYIRQRYIKLTICVPFAKNKDASEIHKLRGSTYSMGSTLQYSLNVQKSRFEILMQITNESKAKESVQRALAELKSILAVKNRDIKQGNSNLQDCIVTLLEKHQQNLEESQKKMEKISADLGLPVRD